MVYIADTHRGARLLQITFESDVRRKLVFPLRGETTSNDGATSCPGMEVKIEKRGKTRRDRASPPEITARSRVPVEKSCNAPGLNAPLDKTYIKVQYMYMQFAE